jgi:hypothetical protein
VYARTYRRGLAEATFGARSRAQVLEALRGGASVPQAAAQVFVSAAQVHGRTRWDPAFRVALDDALDVGSASRMSEYCGTPTGYRSRRCRCRQCRAAHTEETSRYRKPVSTSPAVSRLPV